MSAFTRHAITLSLGAVLATAIAPANATESTKCVGTTSAGSESPTPAEPYPLMAAGWGPELGNGYMASRWAEDWSGMAAKGSAPAGKLIPVGGGHLTLSGELRLRSVASDNAQLLSGHDQHQGQLRAVGGIDWSINPNLRVYGELGAGQVDSGQAKATANFQNDLALQQLFVDFHGNVDGALVGALVGRQEFSDGPKQLISLSDGPNLHRTWNGVRLYAHGPRARFGLFDLRATRIGRRAFDESVNSGEKLRGINGSFVVNNGHGPNTYLEPFWYRTENPTYRLAGTIGQDDRNTYGARLWGRSGPLRFDWTVARQNGHTVKNRSVDAWGLFTVHSLALAERGWKPRLTAHVDFASGGGAYGAGDVRDFNPLYASSNYLGEGQFLGLTNLAIAAAGVSLSPSRSTSLALEYGYARRLDDRDAIYAGGGRTYAGTERIRGHYVGGLSRLTGTLNVTRTVSLRLNVDHLRAGRALRTAGLSSGTYVYIDATVRY